MRSQAGLRKHHYKQSKWRWWNFTWAISNPKRWCCESTSLNMRANLENSAVATGLEKLSFPSIPKEWSNYHTIALNLHASKVMLKILQARIQQYVNSELPDGFSELQSEFIKGRGTRDQIANICLIIKKKKKSKRVPGKHILLFYWLHQSLWLCGSQETEENSSRDRNTRPPDLPLEKSLCRSRSNS